MWLWSTWYILCLLTFCFTFFCTFWTSLSCFCGWCITEFAFVALKVRDKYWGRLKAMENLWCLLFVCGFIMQMFKYTDLCSNKQTCVATPLLTLSSCLLLHFSLASLPSCQIKRYVCGSLQHQGQKLCSPKMATPSKAAPLLCFIVLLCNRARQVLCVEKALVGNKGHLLCYLQPAPKSCSVWLWSIIHAYSPFLPSLSALVVIVKENSHLHILLIVLGIWIII